MPDLTTNTSAADAFSWASLSFFFLFFLLCIVALFKCLHLHFKIKQLRSSHLSYFNGPWITRILLTLISVLLSIGEVLRTSLVKRKLFTDLAAQENVCKGYLVFNLGFAEPCILFGFVFLLRASLQNHDSGTLSRRWNLKTIHYMLFLCIPALIAQSAVVFWVPKLTEHGGKEKLPKSFTRSSLSVGEAGTKEYLCMYPLLVTISLAVIELILICYLGWKGCIVFKEAVNKRLKNRVACIGFWVPCLSLVRLLLLGLSVMPHPGSFLVQLMTFSAFLTSLFGMSIGILILVFYPVNDALVLEQEFVQNGRTITVELPYDDYYSDGASLIGNRSYLDLERNSETSTKQGSISFRTMVGSEGPSEDPPGYFRGGRLHGGSPSNSSPSSVSQPMLPLREVPRY
ncbi:plasminogen activator inhibitor [Rhynchospora pubera]|uniref:Plasminogen activator inhibitor n=1 Tax=Rhynchospora pubera TaxID=906938 RepID=A0AAV8GXI1_9POAL|nr:plasminogen activator inhibitor [Rhynchospora pubera]